MTTTLAAVSPAPLASLAAVADRAQAFAAAARSSSTRRVYAVQRKSYSAWCREHGAPELRAESVALYLAARADQGASVATLAQALAALSESFAAAGEPSPRAATVVRETWAGIRRTLGVAPRQAAPVLPEHLRAMVPALPPTLAGLRDRAVLLLGFAGAFRRSELVALDVADVRESGDGLVVVIRRSKTDQLGQGREVGIPYGSTPATCPVRAFRAWLAAAGVTEGAVFRSVRNELVGERLSGRDVARIVQRSAKGAGLEPSGFSGHSLRAGLATAAARAGKSASSIAATTGHKSHAMVARYVRAAGLFDDNAAAGVGL